MNTNVLWEGTTTVNIADLKALEAGMKILFLIHGPYRVGILVKVLVHGIAQRQDSRKLIKE